MGPGNNDDMLLMCTLSKHAKRYGVAARPCQCSAANGQSLLTEMLCWSVMSLLCEGHNRLAGKMAKMGVNRCNSITSIACSSTTLCPRCFDSQPFRKLGALDCTGGVAAPQALLGLLDCTPRVPPGPGQFLLGLLDCTSEFSSAPGQFLLGLLDCTKGLPQSPPQLLLGSLDCTRGLCDCAGGGVLPHLPHLSPPLLGALRCTGEISPAEALVGLVGCNGGVDPGQSRLGLLGCTRFAAGLAMFGLSPDAKFAGPLGSCSSFGPSGLEMLRGEWPTWRVMEGLLPPGRPWLVMES